MGSVRAPCTTHGNSLSFSHFNQIYSVCRNVRMSVWNAFNCKHHIHTMYIVQCTRIFLLLLTLHRIFWWCQKAHALQISVNNNDDTWIKSNSSYRSPRCKSSYVGFLSRIFSYSSSKPMHILGQFNLAKKKQKTTEYLLCYVVQRCMLFSFNSPVSLTRSCVQCSHVCIVFTIVMLLPMKRANQQHTHKTCAPNTGHRPIFANGPTE